MIVDDLHFVRVAALPAEAHAPLVVDTNAILPCPVPPQFLQAIARRHAKILELLCGVEHDKLLQHHAMKVARQATDAFPREEALRVAIGEALDHPEP